MTVRKIITAALFIALTAVVPVPQSKAASPEYDPFNGTFPSPATALNGAAEGPIVSTASVISPYTCKSGGTGSGQATTKTTAEGTYIFHGCKDSELLLPCNSTGQPSGTIKLESANIHLVYLDENHTKPGVLITPPATGVFAKFSCLFGGWNVEVKGNGLLGQIFLPECGQSSEPARLVFETSAPGKQKYRQVEETGTQYSLSVANNGGTPETAGVTWVVSITLSGKGTLTCPEQK